MWKEKNNVLIKTFKTRNFKEAIALIQLVAFESEQLNHHPVIHNIYNQTTFELTTHDAGNTITEKDHKLSKAIDKINQSNFKID